MGSGGRDRDNAIEQQLRAVPLGAHRVLPLDVANRELLERYVSAFESYDLDALTSLIQEDATQSMPPFDLWLRGRDDIMTWWFGPGIGCQGSKLVPVVSANGSPAFGPGGCRERGSGRARVSG
jgi:RNA polymerase sigma-70 factor (ECF subfamily)